MQVLCRRQSYHRLQGDEDSPIFHDRTGKNHAKKNFRQLRQAPEDAHIRHQTRKSDGADAFLHLGAEIGTPPEKAMKSAVACVT